jgi:hypothetical protein
VQWHWSNSRQEQALQVLEGEEAEEGEEGEAR